MPGPRGTEVQLKDKNQSGRGWNELGKGASTTKRVRIQAALLLYVPTNVSMHDTERCCSHRRTWVDPPGPFQTGSWLRPAGLPSSPVPRKPAQTEAHVDRIAG